VKLPAFDSDSAKPTFHSPFLQWISQNPLITIVICVDEKGKKKDYILVSN